MLAFRLTLCEPTMKLIGRPDLLALARSAGSDLRGAVLSLAKELEVATWRTTADALAAFPLARLASGRLVVELDGSHCAVIAIKYEKGVALVEFAGPTLNLDSAIVAILDARA